MKDQQSQPVLDLSRRDESPENSKGRLLESELSESHWIQGQLWEETKAQLRDELGLDDSDIGAFLGACPPLMRLETEQIMETASYLVQTFGETFLLEEPRLLSYRLSDIRYGVEFLSTMMMMPSVEDLMTPPLLLNGIEGGLQERAVQRALGAAGTATSQANQQIASDLMGTYKAFRQQKSKGL